MRRALAFAALLAGLGLLPGLPSGAAAGVGIAGSIGEGVWLGGDEAVRTQVNFEVLPTYGFGLVSVDLGIVFHLEDRIDLLLRPGARLHLCPVYARLAFPLKVTDGFDWGFLVGVGAAVGLGPVALFVEADTSFYDGVDFEVVPLEFRLGVEIGF